MLFGCNFNTNRRIDFKYKEINFKIDTDGLEELKSYLAKCEVVASETWIDSNNMDFDTIAQNTKSDPFYIQFYNKYKRSRSISIYNYQSRDTIEIYSKVCKKSSRDKFLHFWQIFSDLDIYNGVTANYDVKFPNAYRGLYDKLLEKFQIDTNVYDFTRFSEYQNFKYDIINFGCNFPILYYCDYKKDNAYFNLVFFKKQSNLYKLLIKYHGRISIDIYTKSYMSNW
jgi:hypothetical protein